MKNIQDILKGKASTKGNQPKKLDEKTIIRVFLEMAKVEIPKLKDIDIRETKLKNKTLYIKTAHPIISSELMLRREKIISEMNKIGGEKIVEQLMI